MLFLKTIIVFVFFIGTISFSLCQTKSTTLIDTTSNFHVSAYPVLFYLPETRIGFGGASVVTFRLPTENTDTRPSSFNAGIAYTQNKQLLFFFPYRLYKCSNSIKIIGEIGYYKYFYNHYGIGNDSQLENQETYDVTYPRLHTSALRRFGNLYLGIKTRYDNYRITKLKEGGLLQNDNWATQGGGEIFSIGPLIQYDTKDYEFHPSNGWFVELGAILAKEGILSDASFTKIHLDIRNYRALKPNHIIATNIYMGSIWGDVPFSELFYFGSSKRARGFSDRRYMARSILVTQTDYRFPIWGRFGGVLFGATSVVGDGLSALHRNTYRWSGGFGIRFCLDKKDRVRLRIDQAFTAEGNNFYLTANQAF